MNKASVKAVCLFVFVAIPGCGRSAGEPAVVQGQMDLSNHELLDGQRIKLDGAWEFYHGQFLVSGQFPQRTLDFLSLPGYWNERGATVDEYPGHGFATYRAHLRLHPRDVKRRLALYVPHAFTSYQLYLNGELVSQSGKPGRTAQEATSRFLPQAAFFQSQSPDVEIVIHVANFTSLKGGFRQSIELGTEREIMSYKQMLLAQDLFLIGGMLVIALYHLYLYFLRRGESYALCFAGFVGTFLLYRITTGEYFIGMLFPGIQQPAVIKTFFFSLFTAPPLFVTLLLRIYPDETNRFIARMAQLTGAALVLSLLYPGTQLAEHLLLPAEIVILIVGVYCTAVLAFAFAHRREGATGFLLGFAFFFITVINDILFERDIIQTEVFAPLGLFVLLMADSLMLLRRFVGLIDTVEKQQAALVGAAELKERLTRARLQTKRMEFEMLKKAIQPHFLSNSLAAIRGWLLENPEKSANLLDDFAGEIALIQAMVGQKDVPLADEIRLCRLHLHVMEARREKIYSFRARGMTGHERVPPMIFHTMLENAFTHLDTENGSLRFSLRKTSSKSTTEVVSRFAFAVSNHDAGSIRQRKRGNGIGLRYVQVRLEESFPGSWTLEQKRCRKGYLIRINIKEGADANTDR